MESKRNLQFTPEEIEDGKVMAILAWIIWLIPLLAARDKRYAMFHTEQALVLFIAFILIYIGISIITYIIGMISSTLACIVTILGIIPWILYIIFWIIGLISAIQGKTTPIPIIGIYGEKFNLVK